MAVQKWQLEWPLVGQERVISFLEKSILADKIAQTYIFNGPKDLGKNSLALAFARNLWQKDLSDKEQFLDVDSLNSDIYILKRQSGKKQISVEQAREFNQRLSLSSFFNSYKIGIIKEAHLLTKEAQNALLKTLEEPRDKVLIILLSENISALLSTIVSRSQLLYFYPVPSAKVYDYLLDNLDIKRSEAKEIAAAASGRPLRALQWAQDQEAYKQVLEQTNKAFSFLTASLTDRLNMIKEIFGDKPEAEKLIRYLDEWELLWRDALLISFDHLDRIRYPFLLPDWRKFYEFKSSEEERVQILQSLHLIKQSRIYLQGSINSKNILENLAIYF